MIIEYLILFLIIILAFIVLMMLGAMLYAYKNRDWLRHFDGHANTME